MIMIEVSKEVLEEISTMVIIKKIGGEGVSEELDEALGKAWKEVSR